MKVFVISLKRSVDRRERIKKQLDGMGIEFEFIDAVDALTPDFTNSELRDEQLTRKRFGYKLLDSEVACFSSHKLAWEQCILSNKPILILEDNCGLTDAFFHYFNQLLLLSKKYNFLKLCATNPKAYKTIERINTDLSVIRYFRRTCGTMGYIISPQAAHLFIKQANIFIEPVDDYMEKPYKHGVITYCISPDLVTRAKIESTIGSSRKDKTGVTIANKIYIECFRLYEQIRDFLVKPPY